MTFFLVALIGCNAVFGTKNLHYDYEKPRALTKNGYFNVTFNPEPKESIVDDQVLIEWSNPYTFNTQFNSTAGSFLYGEIKDLKIKSNRTGDVVFEQAHQLDFHTRNRPNTEFAKSQKDTLGFGVAGLDLPYEDYKVSFGFVIYKNKGAVFEQGMVEVTVMREYFEKRR